MPKSGYSKTIEILTNAGITAMVVWSMTHFFGKPTQEADAQVVVNQKVYSDSERIASLEATIPQVQKQLQYVVNSVDNLQRAFKISLPNKVESLNVYEQ